MRIGPAFQRSEADLMSARPRFQDAAHDQAAAGGFADTEGSATATASDRRDHRYTMALAEIACEQIRALRLPADPPSFGVWYAYASQQNPALNEAINEKLKSDGVLSVADLDQLYDRYLCPTGAIDSLSNAGKKIGDEVRALVTLVDAAAGSADAYKSDLADADQKLATTDDRDAVRDIVANLIAATNKAEEENGALRTRLGSSLHEIGSLQKDLDAARSQSLTDPLTRLGNRMCFDQSLEEAVAAFHKHHQPFALLMGDIDHFKKFNDSYGHLVGDDVLRLVAREMKGVLRGQDVAARYGGEEFAVILPNASMLQARQVAERVRGSVRAKALVQRSTGTSLGRITISIGIAVYRGGESTQTLIERADRCLYTAKRDGRDRVIGEAELRERAI
jgi:diguanylate cyclase